MEQCCICVLIVKSVVAYKEFLLLLVSKARIESLSNSGNIQAPPILLIFSPSGYEIVDMLSYRAVHRVYTSSDNTFQHNSHIPVISKMYTLVSLFVNNNKEMPENFTKCNFVEKEYTMVCAVAWRFIPLHTNACGCCAMHMPCKHADKQSWYSQ